MMRTIVCLTVIACSLPGCASTRGRAEVRRVPESTWEQIRVGGTTMKWLVNTLGEPENKTDDGLGTETWRWTYPERREADGSSVLAFNDRDTAAVAGTAYVQLRQGIVIAKRRG